MVCLKVNGLVSVIFREKTESWDGQDGLCALFGISFLHSTVRILPLLDTFPHPLAEQFPCTYAFIDVFQKDLYCDALEFVVGMEPYFSCSFRFFEAMIPML